MATELRRSSSSSSVDSSPPSSPLLAATDSSAHLILIHDEDGNQAFDFSSDDDDSQPEPEVQIRRSSAPPLSPFIVFIYLVDPYLKLGATLLPNSGLPIVFGLGALVGSAFLAAFARQILYLLARHLRKSDAEEVVLDAFARGRNKERHRSVLRGVLRTGAAFYKCLLASIYMKVAVQVLLPVFPLGSFLSSTTLLTVIFTVLILPFCLSKSLASKKVIFATLGSILAYCAWLGCVTYAYTHGSLKASPDLLLIGSFWQGFSVSGFAFCSSSTLTLYSSLRANIQPSANKPTRARLFKFLAPCSVLLGILFLLPPVFFSAFPSQKSSIPISPPLPPTLPDLETCLPLATAILHSFVLVLAIPSLICTVPRPPFLDRMRVRTVNFSFTKLFFTILASLLTLTPQRISYTLNDILLMCSLASTYLVPAVLHVTIHFFKRPISIVVPTSPNTPLPPPGGSSASQWPYTSTSNGNGNGHGVSPYTSSSFGSWAGVGSPRTPNMRAGTHDELLQRKERALQKRVFRKRIVWDVGVWVLLVSSACGFAWGVGRLAGQW